MQAGPLLDSTSWRESRGQRSEIRNQIPDVSRPLFRAQGGDWIDVGGAAGGQKTGKQRGNRQHQTGSKQCESARIRRIGQITASQVSRSISWRYSPGGL